MCVVLFKYNVYFREDSSLLDAASNGANGGIVIILGIIANLVAFVAFVEFLNAMISWLGYLVGLDDINFEWIFSKLFIPLSWVLGVEWQDCDVVAKVIASKTIINEFVAYQKLGGFIKAGQLTVSNLNHINKYLNNDLEILVTKCWYCYICYMRFCKSQFIGYFNWNI